MNKKNVWTMIYFSINPDRISPNAREMIEQAAINAGSPLPWSKIQEIACKRNYLLVGRTLLSHEGDRWITFLGEDEEPVKLECHVSVTGIELDLDFFPVSQGTIMFCYPMIGYKKFVVNTVCHGLDWSDLKDLDSKSVNEIMGTEYDWYSREEVDEALKRSK